MDAVDSKRSLGWARLFCDFDAVDIVSDHPWARVWKLSSGESATYLKQQRAASEQSQSLYHELSSCSPGLTPDLVAEKPERGWLLFKDFEGARLSSDASGAERGRILKVFSAIQTQLISKGALLDVPNAPSTIELLNRLLEFLSAPEVSTRSDGTMSAAHLLGETAAREFADKIGAAKTLLDGFLIRAETLPKLLEHCDLRPSNTALRDDGSIIIFDWEDACLAPPGYSLHSLFSGSARVYRALRAAPSAMSDADNPIEQDRQTLANWSEPLLKAKIITERQLRDCVPAAATAGVIHYVLSFADYPLSSESDRKIVARNISKRLDDILLVTKLYARAIERTHGEHTVSTKPENAAPKTFPDGIPQISVSDHEHAARAFSEERLDQAADLFRENGALIIKNVFSTKLIEEIREAYFKRYASYFSSANHDDTLRVGNKRFMVTLGMDAPFNDPDFFGSPIILPLMKRLLSDDAILGSYTCVTSLPGAKEQRLHKDHAALFPEASNLQLPPFAITMIVPLVDLTEETGTTRLVGKSHRESSKTAKTMPFHDPHLTQGSCFLMDFRLSHQGLANRSQSPRPIVSLVYQRPWFRDYLNYDNQKPVDLAGTNLNDLPGDQAKLLQWLEN